MQLYKLILSLGLVLGFSLGLEAQNNDIGFELQVYPAGVISGLRYELGWNNQSINARIGYNSANRRDWGEHPNEKGGGFGGSLGYRYYFSETRAQFFLGTRIDLWQLDIDWLDECTGDVNTTNCLSNGTSQTTVFQPTAEMGWLFMLKEKWVIAPSISYGLEINVKTVGEEVGQGDILLAGVTLGYRF